MSFVRHIPESEWRDLVWDEIARRTIEAGVTIQDTRDGAVLVTTLLDAIGVDRPSRDNVIEFPVRAQC